jgi:hypothetical protein
VGESERSAQRANAIGGDGNAHDLQSIGQFFDGLVVLLGLEGGLARDELGLRLRLDSSHGCQRREMDLLGFGFGVKRGRAGDVIEMYEILCRFLLVSSRLFRTFRARLPAGDAPSDFLGFATERS